jgi:Domain of unknown function (DUF5050)
VLRRAAARAAYNYGRERAGSRPAGHRKRNVMSVPPRTAGLTRACARRRRCAAAALTGLALAGLALTGLTAGVASAAVAGPGKVSLSFAPSPYSYGSVEAGQTASQTFTLSNTGTVASGPLTLTVPFKGPFAVLADKCDAMSLAPQQSCTVTVRFAPVSQGTMVATLTAASPKTGTGILATDLLTGVGLGRIYWTNINTSTIADANIDGSNPQVIDSGQSTLYAVTTNGSRIYWTDAGASNIWMASTDGSNPQLIVPNQDFPAGIAVSGSHIYWTDGANGTIWQANLDGSSPQLLISGQVQPLSIAADGSHIYWADQDVSGSINEANLDGSNAHVIEAGESSPYGLAVNGSRLYWASMADETIFEAGLDGSDPQPVVSGLPGLEGMTVGSGHVYWGDGAGNLWEAGLNGSKQHIILTGQPEMVGIAITPG